MSGLDWIIRLLDEEMEGRKKEEGRRMHTTHAHKHARANKGSNKGVTERTEGDAFPSPT